MSEQVTIIAHLVSRAEKIEETKAFLMSLIPKTRSENGCVDYDLHQDVKNPSAFAFYENWSSSAALDSHMQTPYLRELVARQEELLEVEPDIRVMTMISPRRS